MPPWPWQRAAHDRCLRGDHQPQPRRRSGARQQRGDRVQAEAAEQRRVQEGPEAYNAKGRGRLGVGELGCWGVGGHSWGIFRSYLLVIASEHGHLELIYLLKIVIFHSYVSLPEGTHHENY